MPPPIGLAVSAGKVATTAATNAASTPTAASGSACGSDSSQLTAPASGSGTSQLAAPACGSGSSQLTTPTVSKAAAPLEHLAPRTKPPCLVDIAKLPGYNNRLYVAIRKLRRSALAPRSFGHITTSAVDRLGSLTDGTNVNGTFMRHLYEEKCNISLSFEPKSFVCHNCSTSPHHALLGGQKGQEAPPCIILTDQAFPAALPSRNGLRCPAIIRVEDATLRDLLNSMKSAVHKYKMPAGATILLSSLSHLCRVGTAAYATDFANAVQELERIYGSKLRVLHGFPLPQSDIRDIQCVRSLLDIFSWLKDIDKRRQHHLATSTEAYIKGALLCNEPANPLGALEMAYRLPTNLKSKEQAAFTAGSNFGLSAVLKNTSGKFLDEFLEILFTEINVELALDLDEYPALEIPDNYLSDALAGQHYDKIVVGGGSHASRLAEALGAIRPEAVVDLSSGGWRVNSENICNLTGDLEANLLYGDKSRTLVVLHLFDNNLFMGREDGGCRRQARRDEGGHHHILGELVTIEKEELKNLVELAMPVFKAVANTATFVLGPTPRYLTGKCCGNPTHLTNFNRKEFAAELSDSVRGLGRHLRSLVWHRQLAHIKVLNTGELMGLGNPGNMTDEEASIRSEDLLHLWGTDPVHPTKEAYMNLASSLLQQAAPTPVKGPKRKAETEYNSDDSPERGDHSHGTRRQRGDHSHETRQQRWDHSPTGSSGSTQRRDHSQDGSARDYSRRDYSEGERRDHSRREHGGHHGSHGSYERELSHRDTRSSGNRGRGHYKRGRRYNLE